MWRGETEDLNVCGIREDPASQHRGEQEQRAGGKEGEEEEEEERGEERRALPSATLPPQTSLESFPVHCFVLCS